ncbi:MAG TPA: S-methyl-5-thioribose-1-phosphate isomerase [Planctomycetota bacterium]|nr:S-methyl-5-thioribose-1-phosphate isomerase [Planctomycetota bacterium]
MAVAPDPLAIPEAVPREKLLGVAWEGGLDGRIVLLDQTRLPQVVTYWEISDIETLRQAILDLVVRGAPAIGLAGAYGVALHCHAIARGLPAGARGEALDDALAHAVDRLVTSRPTAVNLKWALHRMRDCFDRHSSQLTAMELCARLLMEAKRIHREDAELCARIADHGAALLPASGGVLTHCNTGALATGGVGTALGCIVHAVRLGKRIQVYADETRPLLQGARLTALELMHAKVPVTLCSDNAAASLMQRGMVQAVIVGADRITANGDTANKIGTYGLAVLARHHRIPFYVAAPYSTFDLRLQTGADIEIEERNPDEVRRVFGTQTAPIDVPVANPAFDVTPAGLITAIITERGVITAPDRAGVARLMSGETGEPAF